MIKIVNYIIIFAALLASYTSYSQEKTAIKWMNWETAIKLQKEDMVSFNEKKSQIPPKKIFIDVYTGWCGWCKKMDASTFIEPEVAAYMNEHYYAVKMDAEMKEPVQFNNHTFVNPNPESSRSAHQLAASLLDYQLSYPSYVLMDENTGRLAIYKGYQQKDAFLSILKFFGGNQYVSYKDYLENQFKISQQENK